MVRVKYSRIKIQGYSHDPDIHKGFPACSPFRCFLTPPPQMLCKLAQVLITVWGFEPGVTEREKKKKLWRTSVQVWKYHIPGLQLQWLGCLTGIWVKQDLTINYGIYSVTLSWLFSVNLTNCTGLLWGQNEGQENRMWHSELFGDGAW